MIRLLHVKAKGNQRNCLTGLACNINKKLRNQLSERWRGKTEGHEGLGELGDAGSDAWDLGQMLEGEIMKEEEQERRRRERSSWFGLREKEETNGGLGWSSIELVWQNFQLCHLIKTQQIEKKNKNERDLGASKGYAVFTKVSRNSSLYLMSPI